MLQPLASEAARASFGASSRHTAIAPSGPPWSIAAVRVLNSFGGTDMATLRASPAQARSSAATALAPWASSAAASSRLGHD